MVRGENKKRKGKKSWNQMVKFHISPGRLLGDSILLAVHPALGLASRFPRIPTPPPAQPLRPGAAVCKLAPFGRERRGEEGWARGQRRGGGCASGRDAGGGAGGGKGEKAKVAEKKKKNPGWEKSDGPRRETS